MILEKTVRAFVDRQINDFAARLAVLIGADHNIPATSKNILKAAHQYYLSGLDHALNVLGTHLENTGTLEARIATKGLGMSFMDFEEFQALPFREQVVFLVDKHSREFAAYWLMQEYPEVYRSLSAAIEVVDDTFRAFVSETPGLFPVPDLFMFVEE